MQIYLFYTCDHVGCALDPYVVVLPTTNRDMRGFGYRVQPAREGCT
jgi:hypothetical protein